MIGVGATYPYCRTVVTGPPYRVATICYAHIESSMVLLGVLLYLETSYSEGVLSLYDSFRVVFVPVSPMNVYRKREPGFLESARPCSQSQKGYHTLQLPFKAPLNSYPLQAMHHGKQATSAILYDRVECEILGTTRPIEVYSNVNTIMAGIELDNLMAPDEVAARSTKSVLSFGLIRFERPWFGYHLFPSICI